MNTKMELHCREYTIGEDSIRDRESKQCDAFNPKGDKANPVFMYENDKRMCANAQRKGDASINLKVTV